MSEYHLDTSYRHTHEDGFTEHDFDVIHSASGRKVGRLNTEYGGQHPKGELHVGWVSNDTKYPEISRMEHVRHFADVAFTKDDPRYNHFGPAHVRSAIQELKTRFPWMTSISGHRVGGIRRESAAKGEVRRKAATGGVFTKLDLNKAQEYRLDDVSSASERGKLLNIHHIPTNTEHGYIRAHMSIYHPGRVFVGFVGSTKGEGDSGDVYRTGPNTIGPKHIRGLISEMKRHFPDMKEISGMRASGSRRGKASKLTNSGKYVGDPVVRIPDKLGKALDASKFYLHSPYSKVLDDNSDFEFQVRHPATGTENHANVRGYLMEPATAKITGFYGKKIGHPSKHGDAFQNYLGPTGVRAVARSFHSFFPEVKNVIGYRTSGMRRVSGKVGSGYSADNVAKLRGVDLSKALDPSGFYLHPHETHNDPHNFVIYYIHHKDTGSQSHGTIGGQVEDGTFHVNGFYSSEEGHAGKHGKSKQNYFGPKGVRVIGRSLMERVPEVKRIAAFRVSGIRVASGSGASGVNKEIKLSKSITLEENHSHNIRWSRMWDIKDSISGRRLGTMGTANNLVSGGVLRIHNISTFAGPQSLGPAGLRDIHRELKKQYPGVKSYSGFRLTGARAKADRHGQAQVMIPDMYKSQGAEEPEYIRYAAVKVGDKVYESPYTHVQASLLALKAGHAKQDVVTALLRHETGSGFTTSKGRFVSRREAASIAVNSKQIRFPERIRVLDSGDLIKRPDISPPNDHSMIFKALTISEGDPEPIWRVGKGEHKRYNFLTEDGRIAGSIHLTIEGDEAKVGYVTAHLPERQWKEKPNSLGPKQVLQLQRHIVKENPQIKRFSTEERISGVHRRHFEDNPPPVESVLPKHRLNKALTINKRRFDALDWLDRNDERKYHVYDFENDKGHKGTVRFTLRDDGKTAYIHNIYTSSVGDYREGSNSFGPKDIIQLKRHILKQHPTIRQLKTNDRISGARQNGLEPMQRTNIPVTVNLGKKDISDEH